MSTLSKTEQVFLAKTLDCIAAVAQLVERALDYDHVYDALLAEMNNLVSDPIRKAVATDSPNVAFQIGMIQAILNGATQERAAWKLATKQ